MSSVTPDLTDAATTPKPTAKMAPPAGPPTRAQRLQRVLIDHLAPQAMLVRRGPTTKPRIALTFDDGPHALTRGYLDVLERHGARGTFFVIGKNAESRRDDALAIVAGGHEIAVHGFSHRAFPKLGARDLAAELDRTRTSIPPLLGTRPLVRPPYGALSPTALARCARAGYTTVMWSVDSDDCRTTAVADIVVGLMPPRVGAGDIVLFHEGQPWTLEALPHVLGNLRGLGFELVTVSELLAG